ncbi:G-protein coupled receptor 12 [Holothuria leucospilota]|uniref:G-protein coupled receptor 12 n=1 Tax=Holothuria leucospilota TaxID=206669 RepID=A0A9Q1CHP3_HOLLE|nr:G-protein coupled receptor 12 [Holothuria leucospilota]
MVLFVIWIYNIMFGLLPVFIPNNDTDDVWVCRAESYGNEQDVITLIVAGFVPAYFLLMSGLYLVMLRKATNQIKKHRTLTNGDYGKNLIKEARSRRRGLVTMAMLVGAFGLCFLPSSFQFVYEVYATYTLKQLIIVQTFCEYPVFVSSMINPVIYGLRNKNFRKAMKAVVVRCVRCRQKPQRTDTISHELGRCKIHLKLREATSNLSTSWSQCA